MWFPLWSFWQVYISSKDESWRRQEEMVNILQLAVSASLSSLTIPLLCDRQTCRQTVQKAPGIPLSNCLFSASAIVTKALCERPSWILCAFILWLSLLLLFCCSCLFFCFLSADDYLNAKNQYDEKEEKKKKKTWIFGIWIEGGWSSHLIWT